MVITVSQLPLVLVLLAGTSGALASQAATEDSDAYGADYTVFALHGQKPWYEQIPAARVTCNEAAHTSLTGHGHPLAPAASIDVVALHNLVDYARAHPAEPTDASDVSDR
jgi:hypothetical protein